jgi:hypothetical protein
LIFDPALTSFDVSSANRKFFFFFGFGRFLPLHVPPFLDQLVLAIMIGQSVGRYNAVQVQAF